MSDIKIRVGASLDASLNAVFRSLTDTARKASKQVASEAERAAKEQIRAYQKADKEVEASYKRSAQEFEKSEREKVRSVERAARERVQREKAAMREIERDAAKVARDRARSEREAAAQARAAGQTTDRFIRGGAGVGRAAFGAAMRFGGAVAGGLGADMSVGGNLAGSVRREALATKISNSSSTGGQALTDPRDLLAQANAVAMQTGSSAEDNLQGLEKFVGLTGDLKTGRDILADMGRLSKATGSSMEDMVDAAAQVANSMGDIPDKGKAISQAMQVFAGQGQVGAVEIKDMASQMAKLAAQANNFRIDPKSASILEAKGVTNETGQNLAVMGAMAQAARATGGRASATTAVQSSMAFMRDLSSKTELKRMGEAGINVFADEGKTIARDPKSIIMDIFAKTKGALPAISNLLPNQNSRAVVNAFAGDFRRGGASISKGAGETDQAFQARRTAAGLQAVSDSFDKYLSVAMDAPEITKKFNAAMDTTESRVQLFNNQMAQTADELRANLYPALVALTPVLVSVANAVTDAIGTITGKTDEKKQKDTLATDITATNDIAAARAALAPNFVPSGGKYFDAAGNSQPMMKSAPRSADAAGLIDKLSADQEHNAQALADLEKQRTQAQAFVPQSRGGTAGNDYGVSEANVTRLESLNGQIARLKESQMDAGSLKSALLEALQSGTILQVEVKNLPPAGLPSSPGGRAPVESPHGP